MLFEKDKGFSVNVSKLAIAPRFASVASVALLSTFACSGEFSASDAISALGSRSGAPSTDVPAAAPVLEGAVYALTNGHDPAVQISAADDAQSDPDRGNSVIAYGRMSDGSLKQLGVYPTGGLGENIRNSGANPLASQDPLIVLQDEGLVIAVNAGSDSISSFTINNDMSLTPASLDVSTRGQSDARNPVSLTFEPHNRVLYVVNTGAYFDEDGEEATALPSDRNRQNASVLGFYVSESGELVELTKTEIPDVGENAGSIEFSTDGQSLVVTQRRTNTLEVINLSRKAMPLRDIYGQLAIETLDSNTPQPFGTDIVDLGEGEILLVSEGNNGASGRSALSSYAVDRSGLSSVSASTGEEDDPLITGFTFGCWVEFAQGPQGAFAFVANTPDGVMTSYSVAPDGTIALLASEAGNAGIEGDDAQNGGGVLDSEVVWPYLYQVVNNDSRIAVWHISDDGALTRQLDLEVVDTEELRARQFVGIGGF